MLLRFAETTWPATIFPERVSDGPITSSSSIIAIIQASRAQDRAVFRVACFAFVVLVRYDVLIDKSRWRWSVAPSGETPAFSHDVAIAVGEDVEVWVRREEILRREQRSVKERGPPPSAVTGEARD